MSIKPGSKPFNVVMTPSDKKRVMDAKNSVSRNKVNVPELKPETKKAQDEKMNAEFDNHLNESQLNSDESSDFNVASLEYNESSEHSVEKTILLMTKTQEKMNIKMLIIVKTMICLKEINLVKFKIQIIKMIINMILMSLFLKRLFRSYFNKES